MSKPCFGYLPVRFARNVVSMNFRLSIEHFQLMHKFPADAEPFPCHMGVALGNRICIRLSLFLPHFVRKQQGLLGPKAARALWARAASKRAVFSLTWVPFGTTVPFDPLPELHVVQFLTMDTISECVSRK